MDYLVEEFLQCNLLVGLKQEVLGEAAIAVGVLLERMDHVWSHPVGASVQLILQAIDAAHAGKEEREDKPVTFRYRPPE